MSQNENSILLERANELLQEVVSHPAHLDDNLKEAMESGDLERVQYWVTVAEGTLAQEYYEGINGLPYDLDKDDFDFPVREEN